MNGLNETYRYIFVNASVALEMKKSMRATWKIKLIRVAPPSDNAGPVGFLQRVEATFSRDENDGSVEVRGWPQLEPIHGLAASSECKENFGFERRYRISEHVFDAEEWIVQKVTQPMPALVCEMVYRHVTKANYSADHETKVRQKTLSLVTDDLFDMAEETIGTLFPRRRLVGEAAPIYLVEKCRRLAKGRSGRRFSSRDPQAIRNVLNWLRPIFNNRFPKEQSVVCNNRKARALFIRNCDTLLLQTLSRESLEASLQTLDFSLQQWLEAV